MPFFLQTKTNKKQILRQLLTNILKTGKVNIKWNQQMKALYTLTIKFCVELKFFI